MKKTFEMRGKQANILRLFSFDKEGFIHMLFYRVLIFYSIFYGVALLASFAYPQLTQYIKPLTAVFWILITPQLYETVKAFSMIASRGLAFGHLGEEFVSLMRSKYRKSGTLYVAIACIAMALWVAGFAAMLLWWTI